MGGPLIILVLASVIGALTSNAAASGSKEANEVNLNQERERSVRTLSAMLLAVLLGSRGVHSVTGPLCPSTPSCIVVLLQYVGACSPDRTSPAAPPGLTRRPAPSLAEQAVRQMRLPVVVSELISRGVDPHGDFQESQMVFSKSREPVYSDQQRNVLIDRLATARSAGLQMALPNGHLAPAYLPPLRGVALPTALLGHAGWHFPVRSHMLLMCR